MEAEILNQILKKVSKIDRVDKKVDKIDGILSRLDLIEKKVDKIDGIDARLDILATKVSEIDARLDAFATKDELRSFKDEVITTVQSFAKRLETAEQERYMRYPRFDRIEKHIGLA